MVTGTNINIQAMVIMTTDEQSLLRLMTWLSPVFPTGGYAYSHGLEYAISKGWIDSRQSLADWIETLLKQGSVWNDSVLLAATATSAERHQEIADLAEALAGTSERYLETMEQGAAFLKAASIWIEDSDHVLQSPLPVAVGLLVSANNIDPKTAIIAYLQAFVSNQVQAALRLMKLGQVNGVWVQKSLEPVILDTARRAAASTLDDLGSATILAEIASMNHEAMHSRIFRS